MPSKARAGGRGDDLATGVVSPPDPAILDVERGLLGACLLDTRGAGAWPPLVAQNFLLERHQVIWQALLDLTEATDRPDLVLLSHALLESGDLDQVGGVGYLAQLVEEGTAVMDLGRYGVLIRRAAMERGRRALAAEVMAHPGGSEALSQLLRSLEEAPALSEPIAGLLDRMETTTPPRPLITGIPCFDRMTGGTRPGTLVVCGGRTSHGKTAFAAVEVPLGYAEQGTSAEVITLEDPPEEITLRMIANRAGITAQYLRHAGIKEARRRAGFDFLPLTITAVPGAREDAVVGAVVASKAQVVIVDHLQEIVTEDDNRNQGLERVMGRLGQAARRDDKVVIVNVQLSRRMEVRRGEPVTDDLKDCGAIEQKARQIWLVYWPWKHDDKREPTDYLVIGAKNSGGATGRTALRWNPKTGRFFDPAEAPSDLAP